MALFGLFKKTQPVVAIEVLPDRIRALKAKIDIESGKISLVDYASQYYEFSHQSLDIFAEEVKNLLVKLKKSKNQMIVIGFHNGAAITTRMNASVSRGSSENILRESELEDLVFKAQWKIFDKMRPALAMKMGINDLDLHLTDAKVDGVRIDGHRVINPVGFRPRLIEFDIINTFASKKMIQRLKSLIHDYGNLEFVVEKNSAVVNTLTRMYKTPDAIIVTVRSDNTQISIAKNRAVAYDQDFGWGQASVRESIARFFSVTPDVGDKIYRQYAAGKVSESVRQKIEHVFDGELKLFFQGLHLAFSSVGKMTLPSTVFFHYEEELPKYVENKILEHKWPRTLLGEKVQAIVVPPAFIANDLNLSMPIENSFAALLAEFVYGEKGESQLNDILNKRVRWLEV